MTGAFRFLAILFSIIVLSPLVQSAPAAYYVAPYGTATAAGDSDSPRTLASTLCTGCVAAGSTVWLMPGTYTGPFVANVSGTQSQPITIRSVPGTRARLDGKLDINGEWTTWRDLELTYTGWTTRTSQYAGAAPPDMVRSDLHIVGRGTRIERTHIHDIMDVGWWSTAVDGAFVDNVIYLIGHKGTDRGHGHGIYTQNRAYGAKEIRNVISSGNYSTCGKIYGVTAELKHYTVDGLICAPSSDPRFLVGGETGTADDILIKNSLFYGTQLSIGNRAPITPTGAISITDSTIAYPTGLPFVATYWKDITFAHNQVIGGAASDPGQRFLIRTVSQRPAWVFANNFYRYNAAGTRAFTQSGVADYTWGQWQGLGFDQNSAIAYTLPNTNTITVRSTGPHHGTVTVLNWTHAPTVTLDLSSLTLTPGATYRLVNAQNPAEALSFVAGPPVSLPMSGWTAATPIGASAPVVPWSNQFGVFVVEP
jgi:hypothetical protein